MSIKPDFFKPYHLSDIAQGEIRKNNIRTFRGYGSDTTDSTDNVLYIYSPPLKRLVALKAFIDSYKINLTKDTEFKNEADKDSKVFAEFASDLSFDITLNIPAHSVNESRNNTAKLEELQRLISPLGIQGQVDSNFGEKNSYFTVWFKNLISSGNKFSNYPKPITITESDMVKNGFFCYIDSINFVPDMEAGFFDYDDVTDGKHGLYLFPKNIKLSLRLNYGVGISQQNIRKLRSLGINIAEPFMAFSKNGHYSAGDNAGFPFGVKVGTRNHLELFSGKSDYTTDSMNQLDYSLHGNLRNLDNSFLFMSMNIDKDTMPNDTFSDGSKRKRWIMFKGFIDSFSRNYNVDAPKLEGDKERIFNAPLDTDRETTFNSLDYSIKINVPAGSVEEAKKNCAKIQYLTRMFVKKHKPSSSQGARSEILSSTRNALKVYCPSFIENPNTTTFQPKDFNGMYANALELFLIDVQIEVDMDSGFFEERGNLYPKFISLEFKLSYHSGDLIRNYALTSEGYSMLESPNSNYKDREHRFPFPRKTSKIKIGG